MVDPAQLAYWLLVSCLFIGGPFVLTKVVGSSRLREGVEEWVTSRTGARFVEDEDLDDDLDVGVQEDLRRITRAEKLAADLQRLRHLLMVDESMSAVRQLGNRLAYNQLLAEIRAATEVGSGGLETASRIDVVADDGWGASRTVASVVPNLASAYRPRVETIDLRWRP